MKKEIKELVNLLFVAKKMIGERIKESKNGKKISIVQVKTLDYIREKKPTMKDVSDYLGITPPSVTSLVSYFSKNGLAKRVYDRSDRRIIRLEITARGEDYLENSFKEVALRMEKTFSTLNLRQLKNLKEVLEILSKQ